MGKSASKSTESADRCDGLSADLLARLLSDTSAATDDSTIEGAEQSPIDGSDLVTIISLGDYNPGMYRYSYHDVCKASGSGTDPMARSNLSFVIFSANKMTDILILPPIGRRDGVEFHVIRKAGTGKSISVIASGTDRFVCGSYSLHLKPGQSVKVMGYEGEWHTV